MGSTIHVEESVQIARSPTEVWDAIADYSFDVQWRDGLKEMRPDPPGPPANGIKVHEVVRNSGRDYVADSVVSDVVPGTSYRFAGEGTIGGVTGGRRVEEGPGGSGSTFTYLIELEPRGAMRLLRPVLGSMVRSGLKKDLKRLKRLLEDEAPSSVA